MPPNPSQISLAATWSEGARGLITVCGFLAGISATILVLILTRFGSSIFRDLSLFLFVLALSIFAFAAEKFTDAMDYRDCESYVLGIVWYNAAVTTFLIGLMVLLYLVNFQIGAFVPALFSAYWAKDVVWLAGTTRRKEYAESLKAASAVEYELGRPALRAIGWLPIAAALVNVNVIIVCSEPLAIVSTAYMVAGGILLIERDYEDGMAITVIGSIIGLVQFVTSWVPLALCSSLLGIFAIAIAWACQLRQK